MFDKGSPSQDIIYVLAWILLSWKKGIYKKELSSQKSIHTNTLVVRGHMLSPRMDWTVAMIFLRLVHGYFALNWPKPALWTLTLVRRTVATVQPFPALHASSMYVSSLKRLLSVFHQATYVVWLCWVLHTEQCCVIFLSFVLSTGM